MPTPAPWTPIEPLLASDRPLRTADAAPASPRTPTDIPRTRNFASLRPATPTEAAASLMPLGASIGPAGLAVMPYNLIFNGTFFQIAGHP